MAEQDTTKREPWHGTFGGYTNHECRCGDCRAANTLYSRARRTRESGDVVAEIAPRICDLYEADARYVAEMPDGEWGVGAPTQRILLARLRGSPWRAIYRIEGHRGSALGLVRVAVHA